MNRLLKLSALFMMLILSACSSDDEPEPEYTGPWQIEYAEYYRGLHTSDPTFKVWFQTISTTLKMPNLQTTHRPKKLSIQERMAIG